jgi:hypothetical protein
MTSDTQISRRDSEVLCSLATQVAEIAALPVQEEKRRLWTALNSLKPVRPLVHICQEPWREIEGTEYALQCEGELARQLESQLRRRLWRWKNAPADDPVEAVVGVQAVYEETPWGLPLLPRDPDVAIEYPSVIRSLDDVGKINMPTIRYDADATAVREEMISRACGGMLKVESWVFVMPSLWDLLVQWYGTNELMMDLTENPELVHAAVRRCTDMLLRRLRQWEEQGALRLNNQGHGAGNGGLAYTDELPQPDFSGKVRLRDLWGNQMAQIFVGVSPAMHEEFALRYEIELLSLFGLNCYGCCEPLHRKMDIVRKIPRLRRVSMSPWVDWEEGATAIGQDFIFSAKPNPAFLVGDALDLRPAREQLKQILRATRKHGCRLEIVLKDIHTLRREPKRLAEWEQMAMELVNDTEKWS